MKTILIILIGSAVFGSGVHYKGVNQATTSLTVEVDNLPNNSGKVIFLLYNDAKGYPVNHALAYKTSSVKVTKNRAMKNWKGIPPGSYSISLFHDENNNGEFDKSWFGSPKESYGFSNIPAEFCGTPSFLQTSFNVDNEPKTISVQVIKR